LLHEQKQKELYVLAYPVCLTECSNIYPNEEPPKVFTKDQLMCSSNCL